MLFCFAFQPATLRCAVLSAFVEIVIQVYKGNLPEGSARRSRDRLLVRLQVRLFISNKEFCLLALFDDCGDEFSAPRNLRVLNVLPAQLFFPDLIKDLCCYESNKRSMACE